VSVAFVRRTGAGAHVPALALDAPDLFEPLDDVADPLARQRLQARVRMLLDFGRPDLAAEQWQALLARFPDEPNGPENLAALRAMQAGSRR
jgi:hypothetical protein